MRLVRWIIYLVILGLLAWFAANNWSQATITISPTLQLILPLPLLLFAAVLLGALPPALIHSIDKFLWRRRLRKAEAAKNEIAQELADARGDRSYLAPEAAEAALRARVAAAGAAAAGDTVSTGDLPIQARPLAIPPAG